VKTYLDPTRKVYRKIVVKDGRIVGFTLLGEIGDAGVIYHLMRSRFNVRGLRGMAPALNLSLTHLPKRVRRDLLWR